MGDSTEKTTAGKPAEDVKTVEKKTEKSDRSKKAAGKKGAKSDKAKKPGYWKGLKSEFKKITWPDRETAFKQSVAVVAISIVLGIIISVLDLIIQYGVNFITSIG